jgi:hypothetical protein
VRPRLPSWLAFPILAVICGCILIAVVHFRSQYDSTPSLLRQLPYEDAVVLSIDFDALRRAHVLDLLAASTTPQDPEYRAFVDSTGFDYLRDLDSALVAFGNTGTYMLLRGRFDWKSLAQYVKAQGGACNNSFCRLKSSAHDRTISYFPLRPNILALADSADSYAATKLQSRRPVPALTAPSDPAWALIPASALKDTTRLPSGTRSFARLLEGAQRIVFSGGPDGPRLRVQLEVTCRTAEQAAALASQLRATTALLRQLIERERQAPNPRDLSGILTAGVFEQKGQRVIGTWAVQRSFLEALAGSGF